MHDRLLHSLRLEIPVHTQRHIECSKELPNIDPTDHCNNIELSQIRMSHGIHTAGLASAYSNGASLT